MSPYPDVYHDEYNTVYTLVQSNQMSSDEETRKKILKNFETPQAVKHDSGKAPLHLLSTTALLEVARVLEFGANKYSANNWRDGFLWSRPTSAALRHILAWNSGEDVDPESGVSHLAHAMCCLMFLLEFEKTHPELDDRYRNV